MLSHRNGRAFVDWAAETLRLQRGRPALQPRAASSTSPFWTCSRRPARVRPWSWYPAAAFPPLLARLVADTGITVWYSVPSMLTMPDARRFEAGDLPSLRTVLFAGEMFPVKRGLMGLIPHARFVNLYGPTQNQRLYLARGDGPALRRTGHSDRGGHEGVEALGAHCRRRARGRRRGRRARASWSDGDAGSPAIRGARGRSWSPRRWCQVRGRHTGPAVLVPVRPPIPRASRHPGQEPGICASSYARWSGPSRTIPR